MSDDPRRDALIAAGRAALGVPYALPPSPPTTTDCSYWYGDQCQRAGVPIPGWLHPVRTAEDIRAALVPIAFADVLPGDALFFEHTYEPSEPSKVGDGHVASHIGMSLGAGSHRMLNAVEPVSKESDISSSYWQDRILSAGRLPQLVDVARAPAPDAQPWVEGIDLASYQGKPDWDAIAAAGIKFAIIKATEGLAYINPTFAYDWAGAKRVGVVRASYHWGKPDQSVQQQVRFFTDTVGPLEPTDFLMLDAEEGDGDVGAWSLAFLQALRDIVGFAPVCYTGRWFSDPHGFPQHPDLAAFPLALAAYQDTLPAPPAPWSKVTIHQYSDAGQIPGIVGNVDRDRFLGTLDQLRALGKPGNAPAPAEPSYAPPGSVGSGILALMAADGTVPAMPSTWLPLGRGQADAEAEEAIGMNGTRYLWHERSGRSWRYPAA